MYSINGEINNTITNVQQTLLSRFDESRLLPNPTLTPTQIDAPRASGCLHGCTGSCSGSCTGGCSGDCAGTKK